MGSIWPKYKMFELKKYRGVKFDGTVDWCKIWKHWFVHDTAWGILQFLKVER